MPMIVAPPAPVPAVQDALPAVLPFVEVPEWLPLVRASLTARIGAERLTILNGLLQECGGVIAGGSILKSVVAWNPEPLDAARIDTPNDMDIYVPIRTLSRFIDRMFTSEDPMFATGYYTAITASRYCTSFLRKNGIRRVYTFKLPENTTIDIMSVRNRRTPQQVVTNFDLTFCQVWYDGDKVYTTHLDDIRSKRGSLQEDYIQNLRDANMFIRKRIKKYISRGFTVLVNGVPYDHDTFHGSHNDIRRAKRAAYDRTCYAPGMSISRRSMPEYWTKWVASVFTAWSVRTMYDIPLATALQSRGVKSMIFPPDESLTPINIVVPLTSNFDIGSITNRGLYTEARIRTFWANYPDTGYDSEDYEILDNKKFMAKQIMTKFGFDIPEDQALALIGNRLVELQLFPTKYKRLVGMAAGFGFRFIYNLGALYYNQAIQHLPAMVGDAPRLKLSIINEYIDNLSNEFIRITPVALDFAEANSRVYDIHLHNALAAISKNKFINHLKRHKLFPKDKIPCYSCDKLLTFTEIYHIIGPDDYNTWLAGNMDAPSEKWKGYTKGDITFLDLIFSRNGKEIADWSFCPICLSYVSRVDGCNYLFGHKCPNMNVSYSRSLYQKYKNADGYVTWCTQCGRICKDHRHYQLSLAEGPVPHVGNPGNPYDKDCRNTGGGGISEKFIRFSQLRETALALQAKVHIETNENVKNELIVAIWNAPVKISVERKAEINAMFPPAPNAHPVARNNVVAYALPSNSFPLAIPPAPLANAIVSNNIVYPNITYPNGAGADPLLPILHTEGDDAQTYETEVRPVIQFVHRRQNGEVNLHQDEYIGLKNYFNLLQSRNDEYAQGRGGDIGMCWNFPDCDARIHPQEILAILTRLDTNAGDYPEVTAEDKARYRQIYNTYKKLYNKLFRAPVAGGRRKTHRRQAKQYGGDGSDGSDGSFFVEATDVQCSIVIPNGSKAGSNKPRKRKTRRQRRR